MNPPQKAPTIQIKNGFFDRNFSDLKMPVKKITVVSEENKATVELVNFCRAAIGGSHDIEIERHFHDFNEIFKESNRVPTTVRLRFRSDSMDIIQNSVDLQKKVIPKLKDYLGDLFNLVIGNYGRDMRTGEFVIDLKIRGLELIIFENLAIPEPVNDFPGSDQQLENPHLWNENTLALILFQSNIRRYNVTCVPEIGSTVNALRLTPDPRQQALIKQQRENKRPRTDLDAQPNQRAHKIAKIQYDYELDGWRRSGLGEGFAYELAPGQWVAYPPKIIFENMGLKRGAYKGLIHINDDYVGLSLHSETIRRSYDICFSPSAKIQSIIQEKNLQRIVPQIRVNLNQFMARNLGPLTLSEQIKKKLYVFSCEHFVEAAQNIDTLHSLNIVHRDLKPSNMILNNGHIHIIDPDSMGIPGTFICDFGTRKYLPSLFHEALGSDNNKKNEEINAFKKDQYTFFISMIEAWGGMDPCSRQGYDVCEENIETGQYVPFHSEDIDNFCMILPGCENNATVQIELANFLKKPPSYTLSQPIAHYLVA